VEADLSILAEASQNISGKYFRNKMADFSRNRRIITREPIIKVDAGLPAGRYAVALTVIDSAGNVSKPAKITIEITRNRRIG
jgi:uncharacterized protein (DUF2141 family)